MGITKKLFGKVNGESVYIFTLDNEKGLTAEILNYGGIIKSLIFNGTDVVLGKDSIDGYLNNPNYLSAVVGRNSNRILNSKFELGGKTYELFQNDGHHNLHGGESGFSMKVWEWEAADDSKTELKLHRISPDGEEGFPGNFDITVTYRLTDRSSLEIEYEGVSDIKTIINMTNHSYFNLNGHNSGTIKGHTLYIDSNFYTPNDDGCCPTGKILCSKGGAFDFTRPHTIGKYFNSDTKQLRMFGGYDHNFVLNGRGFRKFCELKGDITGITMEGYTDCVGVQIYTASQLDEADPCKDGAKYSVYQGVCLETQFFPNAINYPHFVSPIFEAGEKYSSKTEYLFR